jgi:hypothetical protein
MRAGTLMSWWTLPKVKRKCYLRYFNLTKFEANLLHLETASWSDLESAANQSHRVWSWPLRLENASWSNPELAGIPEISLPKFEANLYDWKTASWADLESAGIPEYTKFTAGKLPPGLIWNQREFRNIPSLQQENCLLVRSGFSKKCRICFTEA